ncbi:ABC transporter ATP-binding protein/permease [Phreatobacter stygius]|uniref:ABC transporter ATP-binding protein/permease n=1 Tax=Phreatobacter stygius TaxID=1940610 RepID=A0A4D7BEF8_9HYPH|nr:SbmA/BacA-like family transporter [Phreatobacter stygius]QCI66317.1 ABC transporter ATP-binding protein/permease [Phreatobacter stygius]
MLASLGQIWRLCVLCAWRPGGRLGIVYFAVVFGLGLVGVHISVRLIRWTADFFNALQKLDVDEAIRQIGVFFILIAISAALNLSGTYIRKLLQIRWRRTLTDAMLDHWLAGKAFWHLRARTEFGLDNPDQRIAEDCRIFVFRLTTEALELITNIVALVSFVAILWSLSTFALTFTLFGAEISIPRYMVWAAPAYVAISSGITHWLGKPLLALNVEQQKTEADFRFGLARFRQTGEAVALAGGEATERRIFKNGFEAIADNWRQLIRRELILGMFTRPYMQTVLRIPLFLALPAFLAGKLTFGGLMQIGSAFQNVVTTLSWFIFSYRDLAELASASARLDHFVAATMEARAGTSDVRIEPSADGTLKLAGLQLSSPGGRPIQALDDVVLRPGETIWLQAPSGFGKTTLLRAIAGLWRHGQGRIERPLEAASFLPQLPYFPLGGIAAATVYPAAAETVPREQVAEWLRAVGLGRLVDIADAEAGAALAGLSGGERQRLALIRLVVECPAWAFLDEPTSALDEGAERNLMQWLRGELPETTFVIVAHRRPLGLGPVRELCLSAAPLAVEEPTARTKPDLVASPAS